MSSLGRADYSIPDIVDTFVLSLGPHQDILMPFDHMTGGQIQVLHSEGEQHLIQRQIPGLEGSPVDIDKNLPHVGREYLHRGDAIDAFQSRCHLVLDHFLQLDSGPVGRDAAEKNGPHGKTEF